MIIIKKHFKEVSVIFTEFCKKKQKKKIYIYMYIIVGNVANAVGECSIHISVERNTVQNETRMIPCNSEFRAYALVRQI